MLLNVEKRIRGGINHAIHRYAKAYIEYMKDYNKNKESSYLKYWDKNNLYDWAMSQKLQVNDFKWVEDLSEFDEGFTKSYNEKVKNSIFLKLMLNIPKRYMSSIIIYHFTWKNEYWKIWKVFANAHDKNQYVIHIKNLKQALNHWLVFQKMHRVIKFNEKAWLK